jgi:hypothetical protein
MRSMCATSLPSPTSDSPTRTPVILAVGVDIAVVLGAADPVNRFHSARKTIVPRLFSRHRQRIAFYCNLSDKAAWTKGVYELTLDAAFWQDVEKKLAPTFGELGQVMGRIPNVGTMAVLCENYATLQIEPLPSLPK